MGEKVSRISKTTLAVILGSLVGVALLFGLAWGFAEASGVKLSFHAWIAIGLGVTMSFTLSGFLFGLSFYSAPSGHDDEIGLD